MSFATNDFFDINGFANQMQEDTAFTRHVIAELTKASDVAKKRAENHFSEAERIRLTPFLPGSVMRNSYPPTKACVSYIRGYLAHNENHLVKSEMYVEAYACAELYYKEMYSYEINPMFA